MRPCLRVSGSCRPRDHVRCRFGEIFAGFAGFGQSRLRRICGGLMFSRTRSDPGAPGSSLSPPRRSLRFAVLLFVLRVYRNPRKQFRVEIRRFLRQSFARARNFVNLRNTRKRRDKRRLRLFVVYHVKSFMLLFDIQKAVLRLLLLVREPEFL